MRLFSFYCGFCRSEGNGVGVFTARLPVGSILHLINEGLAVSEGAGNEGRASCHTLRGYEGGVGVAALVIRGDFIRIAILGGETITVPLSDKAQDEFRFYCEANIVPLTQLYGGKIAAALSPAPT